MRLTRYSRLFAAAVLLLVGIGAYVASRGPSSPALDLSQASGTFSFATTSIQRTPPAGYAEYRDTQYGFSLFYPQELSAKKYDGGGGIATFVFQSVQPVEGFQMYVIPYSGTKVTEERFRMDEPSGVRDNPTYGLIDGAPAAAFYSRDAHLGDTYEIWVIHGGYLYEITTLKPLDTWLQGIMQTWRFL